MHHCWLNGKIDSVKNTSIHISDLGLLRGYAMFDYFRTYNGIPFQWESYWARYQRSAEVLDIANPLSKEEALAIVKNLIQLSGLKEVAIRFILTGGFAENSISSPQPNLLIISENISHVSDTDYKNGIKIMSYEYLRDIPQIKTTDYKHLLMQQKNIKNAGATDILLHKNGFISELSRSNIFLFKDNILITPDSDILEGITRKVVLELAKPHFKIETRKVTLEETLEADEVFTTSSIKRVLAITEIDGKKIGNGLPGKNTNFLFKLINKLTEEWKG